MSDGTKYRFGAFELDPLARELVRDGVRIPLQEHPYKLLLTLLARPRQVVSRDELAAALWPRGTFVDAEHGLNTAIRKLRRALGESASGAEILETLPRHGYRLAASVEFVAAASRASLAVLPLKDLSPGGSHSHVAEGLAEELIRTLGAVAGLTLAPRSAAFRLRDEPPDRAGLRLGVRHVLAGSLRIESDHGRIAGQLVDVSSGHEVWNGRIDRKLFNLLAFEEEVAGEIARSVVEALLPQGTELPPTVRRTQSADAHELFSRARSTWRLRGQSTLRAISLLERALDLDRDFAPALQDVAACYYSAAAGGHLPSREAASRLADAASRALLVAPNDGRSWLVEGMRLEWVERSRPRAARAYERAIDLEPSETISYGWLALLHSSAGRFDDAVAVARRGHAIDPGYPPAAAYLAWTLFFARRFHEALEFLEPTPDFAIAWIVQAWIFEQTGRLGDALQAVDEAVASNEVRFARRERARILAAMGRREEAQEAFDAIVEGGLYFPPFERGLFALARGDRERALAELTIARAELDPWMRLWRVDPRLDAVREALSRPGPSQS